MMIKVFSIEDKEKLIQRGLTFICKQGDAYVFEYRAEMKFALDEVKYKMTNKLLF